eukprot:226439-Pyramimonas_sp.AAC.1
MAGAGRVGRQSEAERGERVGGRERERKRGGERTSRLDNGVGTGLDDRMQQWSALYCEVYTSVVARAWHPVEWSRAG